ncbi:alpha/beta fold hydrolase [Subtercola boreus]|uniref:alpha/beta fold hydrolase n=1 Tax=Subtercola boreus TaxID=120213 RepID=UPI00116ED4D9|nr:alpha/beta fold hydrolase [Subtercola boreus]TQL54032.1 pimeloyl-ACP methyl ester carboxylesterase [Subtercola boreus]
MNAVQTDLVHLPGGALRVVRAGHGPAVVYLHGTGDQGALLPALETLADDHLVVRPDHPGFIESDDFAVSDIADIGRVHEALLDELGIDEFVLIGCSLGGWVAAELALRVPERVRRLVLIDPAGLAGDGTAPDIFALTPEEALVATVFDDDRREAARRATPHPVITRRLARSRATAHRIAGDPYMHDPSLAGRLGALTIPVSILWGREDGIVPLSYAAEWMAALPQAELTVVPKAGHLPHVERPDSLTAVIGRAVPTWS